MNDHLWLTSHIALWVTVGLQGVIIIALLRQVGSLLLRVGSSSALDVGVGPDIGTPAPWMPSPQLSGFEASNRLLVIAFVSTHCGACDDVVPALNAVSESYSSEVAVVTLSRDDQSETNRWAKRTKLRSPYAAEPAAFKAYGVENTPYAFVIDRDALVAARGGINHVEHIEGLIRRCSSNPLEVAAPHIESVEDGVAVIPGA